jgi:anti-anti-sigma regulatory factor
VLRIFITDASAKIIVLQLDGKISGRWVSLLEKTCEVSLRKDSRVVIDLKNVSFSDREGAALLRNLKERGFELLNSSPFIAGQIASASPDTGG